MQAGWGGTSSEKLPSLARGPRSWILASYLNPEEAQFVDDLPEQRAAICLGGKQLGYEPYDKFDAAENLTVWPQRQLLRIHSETT